MRAVSPVSPIPGEPSLLVPDLIYLIVEGPFDCGRPCDATFPPTCTCDDDTEWTPPAPCEVDGKPSWNYSTQCKDENGPIVGPRCNAEDLCGEGKGAYLPQIFLDQNICTPKTFLCEIIFFEVSYQTLKSKHYIIIKMLSKRNNQETVRQRQNGCPHLSRWLYV